MRKAFIVTIGLATIGAFIGVQPAFAEKKTICQHRLFDTPSQCRTADQIVRNNCTITLVAGGFGGYKECFTVDGPPTPKTPWQGSLRDYGKPLNELKNKRQF